MRWQRIAFRFLVAGVVLLAICAWFFFFSDFPGGDDAQQAGDLARRLQSELSAQGITANVYWVPHRKSQTLFIYGRFESTAPDLIVSVARQDCSALKCKQTKLQFFNKPFTESAYGNGTPDRTVTIIQRD